MEKELTELFEKIEVEVEKSRFSIGVTEEGKVLSV